MKKHQLVALVAALALVLPIAAWANNYGVKVTPGNWHLIGVAGNFTLAGEGEEGQTPDLSSPYSSRDGVAVIDVADSQNNLSWDANGSLTDLNQVAATAAANAHFANDGSAVLANLAEANSGLGLPYHSIVGVRAIDLGDDSLSLLEKAVVVVGRPEGPSATNGKDYGSSMRTMYMASPLSSGEPDMMIVYQATMEGELFKVSFQDDNATAWDFTGNDADDVYVGRLGHNYTYDNPMTAADLTLLEETSGTSGSTSQYAQIVGDSASFDMNISAFFDEAYTSEEAYDGNRSVLDGNLTMYRYAADAGLWDIYTAEGDGSDEDTTLGTNNLRTGYGYWVRVNANAGAEVADGYQPGFLARDSVRGSADFYDGKLSEGWNLLAFDDTTLRYVTSGLVIPDGEGAGTNVFSPFGDANVTFGTGAAAACRNFNIHVDGNNSLQTRANTLDVRCFYDAAGTQSVLVSDKPFFITVAAAATPDNITTLAGTPITAADMVDVNGTGARHGIRTVLGEYAVVVQRNEDFVTHADTVGNLIVGVPSWMDVDPLEHNAKDTVANINTAFNGFMTGGDVGANAAQVIELDLNSTVSNVTETADQGRAILLAADERFFVRDGTYIRLFDTTQVGTDQSDGNQSKLMITYDGNSYTTDEITWIEADGTYACDNIAAAVTAAGATDVAVLCPNDTNRTVMFVSGNQLNFDVKEVNTSTELLQDRHEGSTADTNETFKGPFRRIYQPSMLAKATYSHDTNSTSITANLDNLTYTAQWAEDFPNNGPLYYMAGNGYKPEMFITAVTSDGGMSANQAGTISWKALDTTRDPVEWFDAANAFELFWAEKERGYWVYLEDGYTNPVTADNTRVSSRVVTKHFNNAINPATGVGTVFNWFDGQLTSDVGGLVRADYTSGQSYNVLSRIDSSAVPMSTTGSVFAGGTSAFTAYLNDFEVGSLRPTTLIDANVTASDGLGGRAEDGVQIDYVKPATPTLAFNENAIDVTTNEHAAQILIFDGNISDADHEPVHTAATAGDANNTTVSIDMATVSGISYPDDMDVNGTGYNHGADFPAYTAVVSDLRFVASTGDADTVSGGLASGASVYSDMRQQYYVPAYSGTGHLAVGPTDTDTNSTDPYLYNYGGTTGQATRDYGVQLQLATAGQSFITTLIFEPESVELAGNTPTHAELTINGNTVAVMGFIKGTYEGKVFFVHQVSDADGAQGTWYYGIFPGDDGSDTWGDSGYNLELTEITGLRQPLSDPEGE